MAHIAVQDSDDMVAYAAPTAAMVTAWINDQDTPSDYTAVDTGDVDLPALFGSGQWFWQGTAFIAQTTGTIVYRLQQAALAQIGRLDELWDVLLQEEGHYPEREFRFAKQLIVMARFGAYRVWRSTVMTDNEKFGWVLQSAEGPSDLPTADPADVDVFVSKGYSLIRGMGDAALAGITPTVGIVVANTVSPYNRYELAGIVAGTTANNARLAAHPTTQPEIQKVIDGSFVNEIVSNA